MGVGRKEGTRRKGRTIAAPVAIAKPARACVAAAAPPVASCTRLGCRFWAAAIEQQLPINGFRKNPSLLKMKHS